MSIINSLILHIVCFLHFINAFTTHFPVNFVALSHVGKQVVRANTVALAHAETGHPDLDHLDIQTSFGRWKFLQSTLEGETNYKDVNRILYLVLKSFVYNPRSEELIDETSSSSPILTKEQKRLLIEELFSVDENGQSTIHALKFPGNNDSVEEMDKLDQLQPHQIDDEDAYKSCWDLVMEMYGRESTRMSEQKGDREWKSRSSVVRLLIHFDFLNNGIDFKGM